MAPYSKLLYFLSWIVLPSGLFFSFFGFGQIFFVKTLNESLIAFVLSFIFFLAPSIFAYRYIRKVKKIIANQKQKQIEKLILLQAQKHNGLAQAAKLALDSGMDLESAQNELNHLVEKNFAAIEINEEGEVFYRIKGLSE